MNGILRKVEAALEWGGLRKDILLLVISGVALILSLLNVQILPFDAAWVAIVLCGLPIVLEALVGLITAFDIKADVLVSLALVASVGIGEIFAAGEVAFIMQLGALLEELTVARARSGIEKLVKLTPPMARRVEGGAEVEVDAQQVRAGDVLRVRPGETVPADGVILSGQTSVNQAVMTGESMPVDRGPGDAVMSGTLNQYGAFEMRATRAGEDSSIQRMIRLVQSADASKAKIVGIADRWATWIVVIALSAALLTWAFTGQVIRAVTILVVFCPCAPVLATPTAIMAAIGNATRHGFLVREGDALERLALVSRVALDKTGTLTRGVPQVAAVECVKGIASEEMYALCAAAEQRSEHPLGKAVMRSYSQRQGHASMAAEEFEMIPGQGVRAVVSGREVLAGNARLLECRGMKLENRLEELAQLHRQKGRTLIYVAVDGAPSGLIALEDSLRGESRELIQGLRALQVSPALLTGDHAQAARAMADALGIEEVRAHCLPEDKLKWIEQDQRQGRRVCMIGDGVNDAPALKCADVGIAMGGVGSDIAVEAADIALVKDEIRQLPHLIALSRRMMQTIRLNMVFSMGLNFVAIALAMTGKLNPVVGALVHNAGSVLVIFNSALLLRWHWRGSSPKKGA